MGAIRNARREYGHDIYTLKWKNIDSNKDIAHVKSTVILYWGSIHAPAKRMINSALAIDYPS